MGSSPLSKAGRPDVEGASSYGGGRSLTASVFLSSGIGLDMALRSRVAWVENAAWDRLGFSGAGEKPRKKPGAWGAQRPAVKEQMGVSGLWTNPGKPQPGQNSGQPALAVRPFDRADYRFASKLLSVSLSWPLGSGWTVKLSPFVVKPPLSHHI